MQQRVSRRRRNLFYWVGIASLVGGLLAVMWLSVQANGAPTGRNQGHSPGENRSAFSEPSYHSQSMTATVYLPLVANNFPPPPPVFGVQMRAITDPQGLAQAVDAGAHWVRFNAFNWDEIEPVRTEPPTYHWEVVDETSLDNAAANGMEVIAIIRFTPEWAQKVSGVYCGPVSEDRLDEFAQFLQELVRRYSVSPYNLHYWELGNEPDVAPSLVGPHSGFGCWGDASDPFYGGGYYAQMLKVTYPAIKAVDPQARVLIGGLLLDCDPRVPGVCNGPHGDKPLKFLEGILRNGGGQFFDVVSFHAYTYYDWGAGLGYMGSNGWPGSVTAIPAKAGFVREVLAAYGYGEKRLMNTESALLCSEPATDCLKTQAMYVPRAYAEALALGLEGQVYYATINDWWYHTGLLLPDLTPKPVYYAYKTAASFLAPVKYDGEAADYPAEIEGYTFRREDETGYIDVIWSVDGSAQDATVPTGASVYDQYGVLIASSGTIQVNYSPVYVVRP